MTLQWKKGTNKLWQAVGCGGGYYEITLTGIGEWKLYSCSYHPDEAPKNSRGVGGGSDIEFAKDAAEKHDANRRSAKTTLDHCSRMFGI